MSKEDKHKTLILGIGNSGRQDDALGWKFLDLISEEKNEMFHLEYRYQLQIEDAEIISEYSRVIFVDSTLEKTDKGYFFRPIESKWNDQLYSHALDPETILYLCSSIFNKEPDCFIFGLQGFRWDLECGLSERASINLRKAKKFWMEQVYCLPLDNKI